jgi:hypothetical protein
MMLPFFLSSSVLIPCTFVIRKRQYKRKKAIQEIVASEQLYYKFLMILTDKFYEPLRQRHILTQEQLTSIFANITSMAPLHKVVAEELASTTQVCSLFIFFRDGHDLTEN